MIEEIYWNAVLNNDERFNGVFYLGVKTTGIFCRPTCRARTPLRKNVVFVKSQQEAIDEGFRACKRCKPEELSTLTDQEEKAVAMFHRIIGNRDADLKTIAKAVELSDSHAQKLFTSVFKVSPKKLAQFLRLEAFKKCLSNGDAVLDAAFEAGYGSSSRAYEGAGKNMGMSPAKYGKNGAGVSINYTVAESDLGRILIAATNDGVCSVKIGEDEDALVEEFKSEYFKAELNRDESLLGHFAALIVRLAEGHEIKEDIPLDVRATAFQARVWDELRRIPFAETITYGELAKRIGDENSVRAVATACAKNSVALVIPCHRVVGKDGKMRGYRWGIETKKKLLANENPDSIHAPTLFG